MTVAPHGGQLIQRIANAPNGVDKAKELAERLVLHVSEESARDIENIATGAFSPLVGFMDQAILESVLHEMRLPDGTVWPLPLLLPLADSREVLEVTMAEGEDILLEADSGTKALLHVTEVFRFDLTRLAERTYGTLDLSHPGVSDTLSLSGWFVAGWLTLLQQAKPKFPGRTLSPSRTRAFIEQRGWRTVTGFQTRNVPHLAHEHLQKVALNLTDGLLIQPVVGKKKSGDFEDEAILAAYEALVASYFPAGRVLLSPLQTSMRYAGPREAVFHALVRKNFGCTHFIVGRDHAGVGHYYGPYDAQRIFDQFSRAELGVEILRLSESFICVRCGGPQTDRTCPHDEGNRRSISGTRFRNILRSDSEKLTSDEAGLVRPEVLAALRKIEHLFVA